MPVVKFARDFVHSLEFRSNIVLRRRLQRVQALVSEFVERSQATLKVRNFGNSVAMVMVVGIVG